MIKNVGKVDRSLRFLLGLFLIWMGLFELDGKQGDWIGILVAVLSILPFYMALSGSCFVFRWFKIHSLSKTERELYGKPYSKNNE